MQMVKSLFKRQNEQLLVFITNVPSIVRLLQWESGKQEEAVEKKCKATYNVDESEYYLNSFKKRHQPHVAEYFIVDTRVSSKQT